ncbi:Inosine-5'-monophosphate dehydrogenase [Sinobacterium norvegicum]|uniref:Inosine-5'-monophosphate dehydrogenase n=1 Tax=Sinobacterium norvegicum TaxID=1641715 RepID=A0ABN8ED67_9GAMM|nr:putative nucleotidyltransferase substrate binding domain-containing protein [Sinobacterium norvegicum]CAH0990298.1 Inosine-5'-monophosphate dehydrogenase [Sinobacterium norvegicum]
MAEHDTINHYPITEFLAEFVPFNCLNPSEITGVLKNLCSRYFLKNTIIQASASLGLIIVQKGAIDLIGENNQLIERLGEGDSFNLHSLNDQHPGIHAKIFEDSLVLQLTEACYQELRSGSRVFDRFFHHQKQRRLRRLTLDSQQKSLFLSSIATIVSRELVYTSPEQSIHQASLIMTASNVSSILVLEHDDLVGILTDKDIRSRVVANDLTVMTPVAEVMTKQPHWVDIDSTILDVSIEMSRLSCHHLPVKQNGKLLGIITASDLLMAKQNDPIHLVQRINRLTDIEQIIAVATSIPQQVVQWVANDLSATHAAQLLSLLSEKITQRIIVLTIEEIGPAPVAFCWLNFGSIARQEQLLGADQDNGLIISNEVRPEDYPWFARLAEQVCRWLDRCGYPLCPGNIMATNPELALTLEGWILKVERWVKSPTPESVLKTAIFFDLKPVFGDLDLAQSLQQKMLGLTERSTIYQAALARSALAESPPIGMFRRFVVERNGDHTDAFDLKARGMMPITDIVRLHSLAHGQDAVNTLERLRQLQQHKHMTITDSRNLMDAYTLILQLRLESQIENLQQNQAIDNYCQPKSLSQLNRKHLKDVFSIVNQSQEAARLNYLRGLS